MATNSRPRALDHEPPPRVPAETDVLIIGGGVVGLACAYYAQRLGRTVCVVDRGAIGGGASWGNAGLVPVSAAVPLAGPGVIEKSLTWMLQRDGAFRMRPQADPAFGRWLLEFRRQCDPDRVRTAMANLLDLVRESTGLFDTIVIEEAVDFGYSHSGTLAACASEAELADLRAKDRLLEEFGVDCRGLDAAQAQAMEPQLTRAVIGGTYYPQDAHLDPGKLAAVLGEIIRRGGGTISAGVSVAGLVRDRHRVIGAETSTGSVRAREVVVAAGVDSAPLLRRAGVHILMQPGKGYHLEFHTGADVSLPVRLADAKMVASRVGPWLRLTAKLELTHSRRIARSRILGRVPRLASRYIRLGVDTVPHRSWCGFRPLTADSLPYIGRPAALENIVVATGHGQLGVALAPITGVLVADLLSGGSPRMSLEPFRVERLVRR